MIEQTKQQPKYKISVYEPPDAAGSLVFAFVPLDQSQEHGPAGMPRRKRQFVAVARPESSVPDWSETPDDPGDARRELDAEIAARLKDRDAWIKRVSDLVEQLEQWAREMNWATRRIEKNLDDVRIGKHRTTALLMQEDTCRILLEPVGRSAPGVEGVVDLYLMPAYDDIATLYFYGGQWNLHYRFHDDQPVATVREAKGSPLSKDVFEKVLAEMRQNAA